METIRKFQARLVVMGCVCLFTIFLFGIPQAMAQKAAFDVNKMGDM